jgi:hypothetical protein
MEKNANPFQCTPLTCRATALSDLAKPLLQYFHRYVPALEFAVQESSYRRQPRVTVPLRQFFQEGLRRSKPQVGFLGHEHGSLARPLR